MARKLFILVLALLAFAAETRAADPAPALTASLNDEDPFVTGFPLFFSYKSGQWVVSKPGQIFTSGKESPDFELPYLKQKPETILYPRWALKQGWQGTFIVAVEVKIDGTVGRWKIMRSTGHQKLDQAAVDAILRWKFEPGREKGVPIVSCVQIPVVFAISRDYTEHR